MEWSLQRLGILKWIGGRLDRKIGAVGLQPAMIALIKRTGAPFEVRGKNAMVNKVLSNDGVLVVSNHPAESDPVTMIAALNRRSDISLVIDSNFLNIFPQFDQYLIPVYVNHHGDKEKDRGHFRNWMFKKLHQNNLSCSCKIEAHKKNVESIKLASDRINNGELVVLFPGAGRLDGKWFSGVGHLLNGTYPKRKVKIVMAHISGASEWDYIKMVPFIGRFFKKITIRFSQPLDVENVKAVDPKQTASNLEIKYTEWLNKSTWHLQN